jgi:phosphoribosylformylglycinamidine synthase
MGQAALDEAIRNAVCVGVDPSTISVLDNFCWPDPVFSKNNADGKKYLGMLVKTCQGLYDAAIIMETPLISGKDSMKNNFDDGVIRMAIPPTLLISAIGKVPNIDNCLTSQFKTCGEQIFLLSAGDIGLADSTVSTYLSCPQILPTLDIKRAKQLYKQLHQAIFKGLINSAHDISDGGLLTTISESMIGSKLGASLNLDYESFSKFIAKSSLAPIIDLLSLLLFAEGPGQIIVTVAKENIESFTQHMAGQSILLLGEVSDNKTLEVNLKTKENTKQYKWQLDELHSAWTTPLPFA